MKKFNVGDLVLFLGYYNGDGTYDLPKDCEGVVFSVYKNDAAYYRIRSATDGCTHIAEEIEIIPIKNKYTIEEFL